MGERVIDGRGGHVKTGTGARDLRRCDQAAESGGQGQGEHHADGPPLAVVARHCQVQHRKEDRQSNGLFLGEQGEPCYQNGNPVAAARPVGDRRPGEQTAE